MRASLDARAGAVRRGRLGFARDRRKHACELLSQRGARWQVLGPTGRSPRRPAAHDAICRRPSLTRGCARLSGALAAPTSPPPIRSATSTTCASWSATAADLSGPLGRHFIGQTYANMFPRRVRAMVLDGVVDAVAFTKGNEAGFRSNQLAYTDRAFKGFIRFVRTRGRPAAPSPAMAWSHLAWTPSSGGLRRASIGAPSADPPGRLTYSDALSAIVVECARSGRVADLADDSTRPPAATGPSF